MQSLAACMFLMVVVTTFAAQINANALDVDIEETHKPCKWNRSNCHSTLIYFQIIELPNWNVFNIRVGGCEPSGGRCQKDCDADGPHPCEQGTDGIWYCRNEQRWVIDNNVVNDEDWREATADDIIRGRGVLICGEGELCCPSKTDPADGRND